MIEGYTAGTLFERVRYPIEGKEPGVSSADKEFYFGLPTVPLGDEQAAARAWIPVLGEGMPGFLVEIRVARGPDGRLICTGLRAGGHPDAPQEVTARGLRQIPLARILTALAGESLSEEGRKWMAQQLGEELAHVTAPRFEPTRTPRGKRIPDEWFATVADVYREALIVNPRNPYKHIIAELVTSEPTARRWVRRARDLGLLGEAAHGRAGEHGKPRSPSATPPSQGDEPQGA